MSVLKDKLWDLILGSIIKTAQKQFKRNFLIQKAEMEISRVFTRFDYSACTALDFEEYSNFIINRMDYIYKMYTDPLTNYQDNIENFKNQINNRYSDLPKEDLEFVNKVCENVLLCVEWVLTEGLSEETKILLNRLESKTRNTDYTIEQNKFIAIVNGIKNPNTSYALFSYDHDDIFVGRESELSLA